MMKKTFMKKSIITTIIVLSCIQINAQTLTGFVLDKATKQPIPGTYAYLDGTSIVGVTDNSGKFTLTVKQMINTKLVLRHIAYSTIVIDNPFIHLSDTIYMEEQALTLSEVTVQANQQFSRQQRLRAFRQQFLGTTQAGRSCRIVNEDDIQIWFNVTKKTLFASSDKPIEVINEYLGYRVFFTLSEFWAEYSNVTLNSDRAMRTFCRVNTLFTDLRPSDNRIKKRRDDIYEESSKNFFKNLAYNPLFGSGTGVVLNRLDIDKLLERDSEIMIDNEIVSKEELDPVFRIYKDGAQINPRSYFIIEDTLSQKMIRLSDSIIEKENPDNSILRISVLHREKASDTYYRQDNYSSQGILIVNNGDNRYSSGIRFFTNSLFVDKYGNIDQIDKVFFSGLMGRIRMGDMLPVEYEP